MTEVTLARVEARLREQGLETELRGDAMVTLRGVSQDSRRVTPGDLFLAWEGVEHDAHAYLPQASANGAAAALVERFVPLSIPQLRVGNGRRGAALAAHLLLGDPTRRLRVAAVTGTNGKTTTVLLTRHLLSRLGPCAAIGTLGVTGPDGRVRPGTEGLTTPGPVRLASLLRELGEEGVTSVAMEASSHALHQHRLDGVEVDVAAFTNLTRDHLDYHVTLEAYRDAKALLLGLLRSGGSVVVNGEDRAWDALPLGGRSGVVTRVIEKGAGEEEDGAGAGMTSMVAEELELTGEGSRFRVRWGGEDAAVSLPLLGRFNVENALAALAIAVLLGLPLAEGAQALSDAPPPVGRLEVTVRLPVPVILDYAHTPDALRRALETLRPLYPGRLIAVFGAGGDRDREKRPEMGRIGVEGADLAILTSDNPRTEDPDAILDQVVAGVPDHTPAERWERVTDRRRAIARALEVARPGDAILLAGKGHETYQIVGRERRPFDERVVVREILAGGGAS